MMSPHGNVSYLQSSEMNQKFYILSENDESLKNTIEMLNKDRRTSIRKDKICIISVIGKSSFDANNCKASLVDDALGKNIFRGMFCQMKDTFGKTGCQIEGYYDTRNNCVFLHLNSIFDAKILTEMCKSIEKELIEKGFLQLWPELQLNVAKALLLLFHISHIVIIVNPSPHFDLNYIQLFRILDSARQKLEPIICEMLESFESLPSDWVSASRLCSPRVLFVFESYNDDEQFIKRDNVTLYERQLEEQIYRILRKSRIITNISGNSLFAISSHNEFVFISTKDPTIRDPNNYLLQRLIKYCNIENSNNVTEEEDNSHSFYSFLWTHISIALTKGFDDNIGRHAAPPIFELPTVKEFFDVVLKLKEIFFSIDTDNDELKSVFTNLRASLDIDTRFSEARCAKMLPIAMSIYQDSLPSHYTREFHERKLAHALQHFTLHARGPALYEYGQRLKDECDNYWQNGHQMCEVLSLTGNHCIKPVHRLKVNDDESSDEEMIEPGQLPLLRHCSGVKLMSSCDCGRKQSNRDDPFTVRAANHDFYLMMQNKCICGHLERVLFPVFEPSTDDIEVAILPVIARSPASSKGINSLFDTLLSDDIQFESQPDAVASFTNLSQHVSADLNTDVLIGGYNKENISAKDEYSTAVESEETKTDPLMDEPIQHNDDVKHDADFDNDVYCSDDDEDDDDGEDSYSIGDDSKTEDIQLVIRETENIFGAIHHQSSTTECLPGMLHSLSPSGLLPRYSSWSLVCLGPSSIYSHNIGLQDQPGFIGGSNYLLPWDVTVKLEHSGHLPQLWEGKRPPGIKNKKTLKDGTQFTVKIFIGVEYECTRGHRFIASGPDSLVKTNMGNAKEWANRVASNDMPLYMPCACSRSGKPCLSQLMRIHIVTPKAPVHVTLNPRVQPEPMPCPIFYPGNTEPIKLSQSTYWVFRLPFIYEGDHGPYMPPKDQLLVESARLLKGSYGIADVISKQKP